MLCFPIRCGRSVVSQPLSKGLRPLCTDVPGGRPVFVAWLFFQSVWRFLVFGEIWYLGSVCATAAAPAFNNGLTFESGGRRRAYSNKHAAIGDQLKSENPLEAETARHISRPPSPFSALQESDLPHLVPNNKALEKMQRYRSEGSPGSSGDGPVKGPLVPNSVPTDGIDNLSSSQGLSSRTSQWQQDSSFVKAGVPDAKDLHASKDMCAWAFDVLSSYLKKQPSPSPPDSVVALQKRRVSCPLFVTWEKSSESKERSGSSANEEYLLRGCIGSLTPVPIEKLAEYSLKSALEDSRFSKVTLEEIPYLRVKISLLLNFEKAETWDDWKIGKHGIIVKFRDSEDHHYEATYLPEVPLDHGFDQKKTIRNLIKKAGFPNPDQINFDTIKVTRYQSSKVALTYKEYKRLR